MMYPSLPLLIVGGAVLLLALLTAFFGYKLARFLLPFSGLALLLGIIYIYLYSILTLDTISTWLFFGGAGIALYLVLFFVKRLAAFFTGLVGSALFVTFAIYATGLGGSFELLTPAAMTLCVMAGLLAAVYTRAGVIAATSMLGGCAAAFSGLYLYLQGADMSVFAEGNVIAALGTFLSENTFQVAGVALGLTLVGLLVQFGATGKTQVLSDDNPVFRHKRKSKADQDSWTSDMGY